MTGYQIDPTRRKGRASGDQLMVDALLHHLATGEVPWTEELADVVYHHSGGPGPLSRQRADQWAAATNLTAMARSLRALWGEPGAAEAVALGYRDQTDHGQPPEFQLGHRARTEDLSIGYLGYQVPAAVPLYLDPGMPAETRRQAGCALRRDLALCALCATPTGRIALACGRTYSAAGVFVSHPGERKSSGGARNFAVEYLLAAVLGLDDPPFDGVNRANLHQRPFYLTQIAGQEPGLGRALFSEREIDALIAWNLRGTVLPALRELLSSIRLGEQFRVVRWGGGHVSWWPAMHSYNHVQPLAAAVGEELTLVVVGQAYASVERLSRDVWHVHPGGIPVQLPVPAAAHELVFGPDGPPTFDGMVTDAVDPGPPRLLAAARPGLSGGSKPDPKPRPGEPPPKEGDEADPDRPPPGPAPSKPWPILPIQITAADVRGRSVAARRVLHAAYAVLDQASAGLSTGDLDLGRLRTTADDHQEALLKLRGRSSR